MISKPILRFIDAVMDEFDFKEFITIEVNPRSEYTENIVIIKDNQNITSILNFLWDTVIEPLHKEPIYSDAEIRKMEHQKKRDRISGGVQ